RSPSMGDNFLLQQIRNFKKGRDRAKEETKRPTLFERPDLLNTVYPGRPAEGVTFQEGEQLLAVASKNGQHIELVRGHQKARRTARAPETSWRLGGSRVGGGSSRWGWWRFHGCPGSHSFASCRTSSRHE